MVFVRKLVEICFSAFLRSIHKPTDREVFREKDSKDWENSRHNPQGLVQRRLFILGRLFGLLSRLVYSD